MTLVRNASGLPSPDMAAANNFVLPPVTPLFLPPYSPELHPAERLWLWFREHHWSNRVYPDEPSLIREAKRSHRQLRRAQVRSICAPRWLTREASV